MFSAADLVCKTGGGVMKTRLILREALFVIGFFAAAAMSAQFVGLSRCQAAIPCSIPFAVQYRPDPFLAGQYGRVPDSAVSVRLPLETPLMPELDKPRQQDAAAVDAAVRKSLKLLPPPKVRNTQTRTEKSVAEPPARQDR
jgi:hypothetical protein